MDEVKALPFGAGAIGAVVVLAGFVLLMGYQAWVQGTAFAVPVRDFIAVLVLVTFLFTLAYMVGSRVTEGTDLLLGALIAAFSAIVAYYFRMEK
jgi:hypothetical protein